MTNRAHLKAVTAWVSQLANLTAGGFPIADIEARIAGMAHMLAEDFSDISDFTPDSLRGVASQMNSFPAYGKLRDFLSAYWQQERYRQGEAATSTGHVTPLASANMSAEDRMGVTVWLQRHAENKLPKSDMILRLAVIRRYHGAGFRWLIANNQLAGEIAQEKGWQAPEHRVAPPTDEEVEAVARMVRDRVPSARNAAGEQVPILDAVDPNPAHEIDRTAVNVAAARLKARAGRGPGALKPEILEACRNANINIARAREIQAAIKEEKAAMERANTPESVPAKETPDEPALTDIDPTATFPYREPEPATQKRPPMPWDPL